jgi:hypothetical protein
MHLIAVGAQARQGWRDIAAADPDLPVSMTPVWADSVTASGRFADATRLYAAPDGARFVLPLAKRLGAARPIQLLDSWPKFWEAGRDSGGLAGERAVTVADVRGVLEDLATVRAGRVRIVPSGRDQGVWDAAVDPWMGRAVLRTHELDLSGGFGTVSSKRFGWKLRGKIKRAEREGVVVEHSAGDRWLDTFALLHRQAVDRWARDHWLPSPLARRVITAQSAQPHLRTVARLLGDQFTVWVASKDGRPAAAIVLLLHDHTATYWCGATDRDVVRNSGAVQLLHRQAIEYACAAGATRYDMGASGFDSVKQFKESLHAQEVEHTAYWLERLPLTATEERLRVGAQRSINAARRFSVRLRPAPAGDPRPSGEPAGRAAG